MLYLSGSQNASTQRIQATTWPAKVWWIIVTRVMVVRLPSSRKKTRGLQGNIDAKLAITPHRCNTVLVEQAPQRFHWKLEWASKAVYKQLSINLQAANIHRRDKILHIEKWQVTPFIHTMLEHHQKFSRWRLWWMSNRCIHSRAPSFRFCWGDGSHQAKNSIRTHGRC
jgi:hypothetical protein